MKNKGSIIVIAIIGLIVLIFAGGYNSLQKADENVNEKWAQVENQLQRRYDLIPQLVAVVKQYSDYEASTLENVISLRGNGTLDEEAAADTAYQAAMKEFNVTVEAYPDLKASEEYSQLMTDLAGTENRISVARKDYNDAVSSLNKSIRTFPSNIIANMSGIKSRDYFEANDNAVKTPNVSELFNQ
mgnify:FL=1